MKTQQRTIKRHLFICTNNRDANIKESCAPKGSQELVSLIKMRLRENGLWDTYKVTSSGCLGPCAMGISAALYPDNILIVDITPDDVDELYSLLTK